MEGQGLIITTRVHLVYFLLESEDNKEPGLPGNLAMKAMMPNISPSFRAS